MQVSKDFTGEQWYKILPGLLMAILQSKEYESNETRATIKTPDAAMKAAMHPWTIGLNNAFKGTVVPACPVPGAKLMTPGIGKRPSRCVLTPAAQFQLSLLLWLRFPMPKAPMRSILNSLIAVYMEIRVKDLAKYLKPAIVTGWDSMWREAGHFV